MNQVAVYLGDSLGDYHFGESHPFGPLRLASFSNEFFNRRLDRHTDLLEPSIAIESDLLQFHEAEYIQFVKQRSAVGEGYLDGGDTPAIKGIYAAACTVVGTVLAAVDDVMKGNHKSAFVPIAGLHHARRDSASGFCVFNDCGVAAEVLRTKYGLKRIAYVDIDAHHGDGVFYAFEDDPYLIFADSHQYGQSFYPGTGGDHESGLGKATGSKLNCPLAAGAGDEEFAEAWEKIKQHLHTFEPEFILFQCGADSIQSDPITQLCLSASAHRAAASDLSAIAKKYSQGRLVAMGGGGYNLDNIAAGWNAVVEGLIGDEQV